MSISLICYLIACVLFLLASYPPFTRGWMIPLGLAFFVLGHILAGIAFKQT